ASPSGTTVRPSTTRSWITARVIGRWSAPASRVTQRSEAFDEGAYRLPVTHRIRSNRRETTMNFLDGALFPENQEKLVITAAPYGPEWLPSDFTDDIAVSMDEQVQKAVDCYNAGATVLH